MRIPLQVRSVLFDAVGTLIRPEPPVARAYYRLGRQFGSALSETEASERFRAAFGRQGSCSGIRENSDETLEHQRWRQIVAEVFHELPDSGLLFEALWAHFAEPSNWAVFDDADCAWQRLAERGLILGVASNFDARLSAILDHYGQFAPRENWFVSSQLGWRKPSLAFFRAIEARLGMSPEELLLIGDDWQLDFEAARSAGWNAVWLNRGRSAEDRATPRQVASLAELV